MKKNYLIAVIFLFFVTVVFSELSGIKVYAEEYPPEISAVSGIVIDGATGRVLYEKNADSRQLPASTTKIMTCLLALESGHKMNEMVKISKLAAETEGSSVYMTEGEKISFEDLLYALMLRSGNDSAVALAEYISGSTEEFAELMNKKAKEIGAKSTNFVTVNGLQDENHYTTAYDMALISREAMKNDTFRKIVGSQTWNASRDVDKFNYFYNKNKVLHQYKGGNGIKIGYTTVAGRCLVASSQRDGMELICVVFSAPDWFNDSYKLMDYIYDNYESKILVKSGEKLAVVKVKNGDKRHTWMVSNRDIAYPKRKGEDIEVGFEITGEKSVSAPIVRGISAGFLHVLYNGEEVGVEELVYREDVEEKLPSRDIVKMGNCIEFLSPILSRFEARLEK